MARGIRKCLTFVKHQISSKIFRKNNTQALVICEKNVFLLILIKSTLDSLKSVFNVLYLGGNRRWVFLYIGAPQSCPWSLSDDWILACSSQTLAFSFVINFNQPHKWSSILKCFSPQKGVFSFQINEWIVSWIFLALLLTIGQSRTLERGRLVSIRWLENLDHMALARGKWKRSRGVLVCCVLTSQLGEGCSRSFVRFVFLIL